jgi:hypothetical protein
MGQPLIHRTQLAASVEAVFFVGVDEVSDVAVFFSDFDVSVLVPLSVLAPLEVLFESPLSDVIDDEAAPRLSVL